MVCIKQKEYKKLILSGFLYSFLDYQQTYVIFCKNFIIQSKKILSIMSLNKVVLIGRVGKDPEIQTLTNNSQMAHLSVATSESWKDKKTGEKKEKTEWHKVTIFQEGLVNLAKTYIKKGSRVYVEGKLVNRKWKDNNIEKTVTEVVLQGFNAILLLLDNRPENTAPVQGNANSKANTSYDYSLDDDIPF